MVRPRALAPRLGCSLHARSFLPAIGEAVPTLPLDRAGDAFTEAEVSEARHAVPPLAALHRRHLDPVVAAGVDR